MGSSIWVESFRIKDASPSLGIVAKIMLGDQWYQLVEKMFPPVDITIIAPKALLEVEEMNLELAEETPTVSKQEIQNVQTADRIEIESRLRDLDFE